MEEEKKKIVKILMEKGLLVNEELLLKLEQSHNIPSLLAQLEAKKDSNEDLLVLCEEGMGAVNQKEGGLNWKEFDESRAQYERTKQNKKYEKYVELLSEKKEVVPESENGIKTETEQESGDYKVVFSYTEKQGKKQISDFISYFNKRFSSIERILSQRSDLSNLTSIARVAAKKDRENIAIVGMIHKIGKTKNDNIILTVEDPTGQINAIISKSKPELYNKALDLVEDEVIGIMGVNGNNIIFVNNIVWPEIPLHKEFKKYPEECYAAFLSDLHVGSKLFLKDSFEKFVKWLNGTVGSEEQKAVANKVKYLFIVGDLVDGVGIYPGQEGELEIKDIYAQYRECKNYLAKIPKHIKIIVCPGNHDAMRLAEPQPPFYKDLSEALWELPNIEILSNPSTVNVLATEDFPGFDVLLYHGYCFDYYISNVDSIRNQGGYDRADLVMKFLLTRRHLAPTHTSTVYLPDKNKDPLVIEKVPDFFVTGHIHKTAVCNYRSVTMLCGSCWQAKTSFQEKVGHHPEPARVPLVNFKTREVKVLKF